MVMNRLFQKFKQDIVGVFLFTTGLFVGLALFSFNPTDPSFNSIGKNLNVSNYCGYVGSFLADGLFQLFGMSAWMISIGAVMISLRSFKGEDLGLKNMRLLWIGCLIVALSTLTSVYFPEKHIFQGQIYIGGLVGLGLSQVLIKVFNPIGVQILLWAFVSIVVIFFSEKTIQELTKIPRSLIALATQKFQLFLKERKKKSFLNNLQKEEKPESRKSPIQLPFKSQESTEVELVEDDSEDIEDSNKESSESNKMIAGAFKMEEPLRRRKVTLKTKVPQRVENWNLPKLALLEDPPASRIKLDKKEIEKKAEILKEKLSVFEVTGEVVAAIPGPAVTMFEFKPSPDVKVSDITNLENDITMALSSESLRILAPIPGRDVVGIETSNAQRETVYLKDMLADEEFWKDDIKLPIALGKTSTGSPKIVDLRRMPHLMVAGTTGSGKSVFTVSMITGLLFRHSPKTLKMIIVDPKQVDYSAFEKIPHLAVPIITDTKQAVIALKWAVHEMEKRYKSMSRFGARKLEDYNDAVSKLTKSEIEEHEKINADYDVTPGKKAEKYYSAPLPYLVIILEEFGDIMSVDKNNVEPQVVRLAQKARACGIHLVLAMQSPRKEVVTGQIKMNIPGRIAFKVSSSMDSRIILDETGAERLLANGDMLFKSPGTSSLVRHHGPYLKDSEISEIANFWADQMKEPEYDSSALKALDGSHDSTETSSDGGLINASEYDDKYDEILSWASSQKSVSASLIQRRFAIGYPRAARIIETFEQEGVVGPANGSKPRQVLINSYDDLDK